MRFIIARSSSVSLNATISHKIQLIWLETVVLPLGAGHEVESSPKEMPVVKSPGNLASFILLKGLAPLIFFVGTPLIPTFISLVTRLLFCEPIAYQSEPHVHPIIRATTDIWFIFFIFANLGSWTINLPTWKYNVYHVGLMGLTSP